MRCLRKNREGVSRVGQHGPQTQFSKWTMRSSWYLIHRFYDHPPLEECQDWWSSETWDFPGLRVGCMNLLSSVKSLLGKKNCNRKTGRCWTKKTKQKNTVRWWTVRVRRGGVGDDGTRFQWGGGHTTTYSTALTRACFFDWPGPWLTPPALLFFLAALKMAAGSVPVSSVPFPALLLSPWWWLQQQPAWQWGLSEAGG